MTKIGFFELEGWEEKLISENFPNQEITASQDKINELSLPQSRDFEILSIFVDSRIDKGILENFPQLKCITTRSTGFDHIDVAACKEKGIKVLYVPGYGDNTVAEFAFGLILSLTRKIYEGVDRVKETGSFSLNNLRGVDIKGKTMGIIGTGRIGREMINMAIGFGMNVLAYDPYPDQNLAKDKGITYLTLNEVLERADIISIHCPYNEDTHHLIGKNNINKIKRGAYLINTARGAVVETEALIEALNAGILAGAGLDVLEEEGETKDELNTLSLGHPKEEELKIMLRNHMLMKMPNVLVTPHNAFNSQEAMERILKTTLDNINGYLKGELINEVK